jgi:Na+/proline symporter
MKNQIIAIVIMLVVFLFPVRIAFLTDDMPGMKMILGMIITIIGTYLAMFIGMRKSR